MQQFKYMYAYFPANNTRYLEKLLIKSVRALMCPINNKKIEMIKYSLQRLINWPNISRSKQHLWKEQVNIY